MAAKNSPLIVIYAIALHFAWAFALACDRTVGDITGLSIFDVLFFPGAAIAGLALSAALSFASLFVESAATRALMLLPQQFMLMLSAAGALVAIGVGHYPDGVLRPSIFIMADQIHLPLLAVLHAYLIVQIVRRRR